MSPTKAYAAFSTAVQSSGDTLPESIQWMPPGRHAITAVKDGEPFEMEIEVNEALASRVAALLQQYRDKAAHAEGDLPFFDFNHNDAEASAHPLQMYWAGDDPRQGGIRARLQWTGAGADAIQRRTFRRFSPQFLTDENKNVIGVGINMGGLVNRAAFRKIQPIWSRDAAELPHRSSKASNQTDPSDPSDPSSIRNPQSTIRNLAPPMDPSQATLAELTTALTQLTATVAAHANDLKAIQAKLAEATIPAQAKPGQLVSEPRILELEQQLAAATEACKVAARAQAERAVASAAAEGKLPPQDQNFFKHLVDVFAANPDAGKVILARMPVNPALQSLVSGSAAGRTTIGHTEPAMQFAALVKAKAGQFKGDRSRAIDAAIDECPQLYKAWREANGQPLL
jgi:phage I-like protein